MLALHWSSCVIVNASPGGKRELLVHVKTTVNANLPSTEPAWEHAKPLATFSVTVAGVVDASVFHARVGPAAHSSTMRHPLAASFEVRSAVAPGVPHAPTVGAHIWKV